MAEDEKVSRNRLALLGALSDLLSRSADFSEIVVAGETAKGRA
jgi:glycyl-tRNA synthetase beta subunit